MYTTQHATGKLNAKPKLEKSREAPQFTFCNLKAEAAEVKVGRKAGLADSIFKKAVNSQIFPAISSGLRFRLILTHRTKRPQLGTGFT